MKWRNMWHWNQFIRSYFICVLWFLITRGEFDCVCEIPAWVMGQWKLTHDLCDPWKCDIFNPLTHDPSTHCLLCGHLATSKSTCRPNFGDISQSVAEILLLSFSENKRLPCWNFTSGFDFRLCLIIDMPFCICIPNFVQIGPSAVELLRHSDFQDGGRQPY